MFEALLNTKSFIRVRKPKKVVSKEENLYMYDVWRFGKKKEFIYFGEGEGVKPDDKNIRCITINENGEIVA